MHDLIVRRAREADLPALVAMFAADDLGGHGDTTDEDVREDYLRALHAIDASPNDQLFAAELEGEVVGTFQILFHRALTGRGALSMIIGAVQTRRDMRGRGIGSAMINHAIEEARRRDCRSIRLVSSLERADAHRFYERLGFTRSHAGFKMKLR